MVMYRLVIVENCLINIVFIVTWLQKYFIIGCAFRQSREVQFSNFFLARRQSAPTMMVPPTTLNLQQSSFYQNFHNGS